MLAECIEARKQGPGFEKLLALRQLEQVKNLMREYPRNEKYQEQLQDSTYIINARLELINNELEKLAETAPTSREREAYNRLLNKNDIKELGSSSQGTRSFWGMD
jgi:hypothetical protein